MGMLSEAAVTEVRRGKSVYGVVSLVARKALDYYSSDIVLRHGQAILSACSTVYQEETQRIANKILCAACKKGFTDDEYDARHWSSENDNDEYHAKCCPECKEVLVESVAEEAFEDITEKIDYHLHVLDLYDQLALLDRIKQFLDEEEIEIVEFAGRTEDWGGMHGR